MNKWVIDNPPTKLRLDIFLSQALNQPRHQAQKLIRAGRIRISGQVTTTPHHWLKQGMVVELADPATPKKVVINDVPILNQTVDFLVINKPANLAVHPAAGINEPTLVDWLNNKYPKIKKIGDDLARPGIVHRLDKLVSGCLVIALSQNMFDHLKKQFADRTVNKEYLALVAGRVEKDEGVINRPIGRNKAGRLGAHQRPLAHDRQAVTAWEVIKRFTNATLLKLKPATGRTHQLRVHCRALGHPIIGDPLYADKKQVAKLPKLNRIFLHAAKLQFIDLTNHDINITCPLPGELNLYLQQLKPL